MIRSTGYYLEKVNINNIMYEFGKALKVDATHDYSDCCSQEGDRGGGAWRLGRKNADSRPHPPLQNGVWGGALRGSGGGAPATFLRRRRHGVWAGAQTPCVHDYIKPAAGLVRRPVVNFV